MIEIQNVTKVYGKQTVLSCVSATLEAGKIYGLVGINGSGKTTLMRCICGFTHPTSGKIIVNGDEIGKKVDFPKRTGIIIETPGFLPHYSGLRNLLLLAGVSHGATKERAAQVMRQVKLDPDEKKPLRRKNPTDAFMSGFYCIIMALKRYYYNILISNNMDFMDNLVNLNRRIRKLSSTGENVEVEKNAPKYTCIITSEADLPDKQLDYFADNPWDGDLHEVITFNTIGELFQHDVEGLFYQLYENEHGTRLGYGMVDPDYPATDIQDFEKKSEKKEQKNGTVPGTRQKHFSCRRQSNPF